MDDSTRNSLLDDITRGLRDLDGEREPNSHRTVEHKLWRIEVAFLDDDGDTVRVGGLAEALDWVVNRSHQSADARDLSVIHDAASAHVYIREGHCTARGCPGDHRDPDDPATREVEVRAAVRKLDREQVVRLLTGASIECSDDEVMDELREALVQNVLDGTIDAVDLDAVAQG